MGEPKEAMHKTKTQSPKTVKIKTLKINPEVQRAYWNIKHSVLLNRGWQKKEESICL